MSMRFERDERKFDFHDIGREIKRKREASGMTQEQLAFIIDRDPRTVMYHENDGQHPSLNIFYQLVTRFDISVDQFFYPDKGAASGCKSRIDVMLSSISLIFQFMLFFIYFCAKIHKKNDSTKGKKLFFLFEDDKNDNS